MATMEVPDDLSTMSDEELERSVARAEELLEALREERAARSGEGGAVEDAADDGSDTGSRSSAHGPKFENEPLPPHQAKGGPDRDDFDPKTGKRKGDGLSPLQRTLRRNAAWDPREGMAIKARRR